MIEKSIQNFGDVIAPHIVRKLSGMEPALVLDRGRRYLCSGSILPDLREGDIVWGSGMVRPEDLKSVPPNVKFCAVRGPLTRDLLVEKFGQEVPKIYGAPCLLIPKLFDVPKVDKEFLGIVPHMLEYREILKPGNPFRDWYSRRGRFSRFDLIDITSGFDPVLEAISGCAYVISSSLHALILADALGIPNAFAQFVRHKDMERFSWKFHDYFLSVGRPTVPPIDCSKGVDTVSGLVFRPSTFSPPRITFDYGKFFDSCPFNFKGVALRE